MPDPVTAGWAALSDGRRAADRALFEDALAHARTPVAYEGLSWAAWWLDDAATVFDARTKACRLYRHDGDAASAGRMATWLAADQVDFRERALYAAEIGRRFGVADLEMLGLALEGAVLIACADVDEGMRRLDEATTIALQGDATIPISGAWACCFLVTAGTAVSDYARAFEWCDRIAEFAERYGSRYTLAFCRAEYGAVHLWRGRWAEAESMLESSLDDFSRSRPPWTEAPLVGLAELRTSERSWQLSRSPRHRHPRTGNARP